MTTDAYLDVFITRPYKHHSKTNLKKPDSCALKKIKPGRQNPFNVYQNTGEKDQLARNTITQAH